MLEDKANVHIKNKQPNPRIQKYTMIIKLIKNNPDMEENKGTSSNNIITDLIINLLHFSIHKFHITAPESKRINHLTNVTGKAHRPRLWQRWNDGVKERMCAQMDGGLRAVSVSYHVVEVTIVQWE